jgi:disulfide bond formation protein DsbB
MLSRDSISGLVCLAISLFLLVLTFGLPPAAMVPIGPAFYPRVVLSLTAVLSVILIGLDIYAARTRPAAPAAAAQAGPAPNFRMVLATFVLFGLYIAVMPKVGFRISTFLFVLALQITLEWPQSRMRWLLAVAVAIATALICHFIFEDYLSVLLPRGTWSGM